MFRPVAGFIALRYLRAKRKNRFASFISAVSVLGIALGVAVLIVVLSVMNGFEKEVVRHILGIAAHATIFEPDGYLNDWQVVERRIASHREVAGTAPYIRAGGMLNHRGVVRGVVIHGILPSSETRVSRLAEYVDAGDLAKLVGGAQRVLLGRTLAADLHVQAGDRVTLIAPQWDREHGAQPPRYRRLEVAGTFSVGMHEFDSTFVVMHLGDAAEIFGFGARVSGIRLRVDSAERAPAIAAEVAASLPGTFLTINWTQYHRNFFLALQSQKQIMFVILSLIVAVGAFNIVATMAMVVNEKQGDIAILRTLGISTSGIMLVFVVQGVLIGLLGSAGGVLLGTWGASETEAVVTLIERTFRLQFIKPDVYYINYLPSDLRSADILAVCAVAFLLCVGATLYPAWRAARVHPVEALRHE